MPDLLIDRAYFEANFPSARLGGKTLTASRKQGFTAIFDAWDATDHYDVLEWLAYMLAIAWHEVGATMQPVHEGFKDTDAEAYAHVTAYCRRKGIDNYARRHANGNSYYGRGYVQLTHSYNYKTMGERLGMGNRLYTNPDEVMKPAIAAKVLTLGMIDGLFRPSRGTLFTYFNSHSPRWFDARDLINGDKNTKPQWAGGKSIGTLVADYGKAFLGALRYSEEA